jgi:transcriptional regulator with XRE-family HTH domain
VPGPPGDRTRPAVSTAPCGLHTIDACLVTGRHAAHRRSVADFDLPGLLRRIRRLADLSQRELAEACGVSQAVIARAETGRGDLSLAALRRAAATAGLRLELRDEADRTVSPMSADAVCDAAGRRFPAHLDTRFGDEDWWHGPSRYDRAQPWYTFDRSRATRDVWREHLGTPVDHLVPSPGDSPAERAAARAAAAREHRRAELQRRVVSGEIQPPDTHVECTCPAACDELDDWSGRPVHAEKCPCSCDVG